MRLRPEHREAIRQQLDGDEQDTLVACNVIEILSDRVRGPKGTSSDVNCDFVVDKDVDPDHFRMRFTSGFAILSHGTALAIDQASPRVVDVRLLMSERCVEVVVRRHQSKAGSSDKNAYALRTSTKRVRSLDIDFEKSGVDPADRDAISTIADEVYQSCERVPIDMLFWFETVHSEHGAKLSQERGGAVLPKTDELADESVSESLQPSGEVMGFSLCFSGMPDTSYAFMHHLHKSYPALIASSYAWMRVPNSVDDRALFVVNIRRADAPVSEARRVVQNSQPRGIRVRVAAKRQKV